MPPNDNVTEMMTGERETVDPNVELDEDGEPVEPDDFSSSVIEE